MTAKRILGVARARFAAGGYAGTSLRSIARDAGVDPALVLYYYQSKSGLLDAVLAPPAAWTDAIAAAAAAPIRQRGVALVRTLLAAWEDPSVADFLRSAVLTAAHEPIARERIATSFAVYVLDAVSSRIDGDERLVRASLVSTQMVGLAIVRHVWCVGAVATMSSAEVVRLIAPTIQRYLSGSLGAAALRPAEPAIPDG